MCPPGSTLTYTNFAKPFMEKYCNECHARDKHGDDRKGAPSFHDFNTVFGVRAVHDHIDETTAAGPAAVNDGMPQSAPFPTLEELRGLVARALPDFDLVCQARIPPRRNNVLLALRRPGRD